MKAVVFLLAGCLLAFRVNSQSLSLDEFNKNKNKKEKEKATETETHKTDKNLTPEEIPKARDLYAWYNVATPCSAQDSIKRTSSWIKQKLKIDHGQFLKYLNYMGGTPRKEDLPN